MALSQPVKLLSQTPLSQSQKFSKTPPPPPRKGEEEGIIGEENVRKRKKQKKKKIDSKGHAYRRL